MSGWFFSGLRLHFIWLRWWAVFQYMLLAGVHGLTLGYVTHVAMATRWTDVKDLPHVVAVDKECPGRSLPS